MITMAAIAEKEAVDEFSMELTSALSSITSYMHD